MYLTMNNYEALARYLDTQSECTAVENEAFNELMEIYECIYSKVEFIANLTCIAQKTISIQKALKSLRENGYAEISFSPTGQQPAIYHLTIECKGDIWETLVEHFPCIKDYDVGIRPYHFVSLKLDQNLYNHFYEVLYNHIRQFF